MRIIAIPLLCILVVACRTTAPAISFATEKSAAPFRAVVVKVHLNNVRAADGNDYLAVKIQIRRADGALVTIATDRATLMQAAFAQNLVQGRAYDWPKVITDFEQEMKQKQRANHEKTSWVSPSTTN